MATAEIQLNDPQTLYRRWEQSPWSPFELDLSTDREQWPELGEREDDVRAFALAGLTRRLEPSACRWRPSMPDRPVLRRRVAAEGTG